MRKLSVAIAFIIISVLSLLSCAGSKKNSRMVKIDNQSMDSKKLILEIDEKNHDVVWDDNRSVEALKNLVKNVLAIFMSNYAGFEQVGDLGQAFLMMTEG